MKSVHQLTKGLVEKVSRDTTTGQFIAEIDGLRFVAIFSVLLFHIAWYVTNKTSRETEYDPLVALLSHGDIGVQLFFVISGAVIALPFAKAHLTGIRKPMLRQYFFRRLTRLEPPYILNLLAVFSLTTMFTDKGASNLVPHLLASMGYLHNMIFGQMSSINAVAWSLEIELQFYVLAPLITSVFIIKSKMLRRAVIVGSIIFFSYLWFMMTGSPRYSLSVFSQAQYFLTGFLLMDIYITEWDQRPTKSVSWDLLSAFAWLLVLALLTVGRMGKAFLVIPVFIAYCGAFKGVWFNWLFRRPFIYTIGGMCYTIYLYHCQVITTFLRIMLKSRFLFDYPLWLGIVLTSLLVLPLVLVITTLLFIGIEKPCMRKDWHIQLLERVKTRVNVVGAP